MTDSLGIFHNVPFDEYAKIDALNGSSIINMRKSPMYYRHRLDNPEPPTSAMKLGTAVHRMILEPDTVGDIAVWGGVPEHFTEKKNLRPRNGKDWDAFGAEHSDKLIVTKPECDAMVGMAIAARKNPPIYKYANAKGYCEVTMVWVDPVSGRKFKGRIDKLIPKGQVIFDLKTTRDCSKYKFGSHSYSLGYHIKMALYWNGYKTLMGEEPKLVLGAIESKKPHECAVYRLTTDVILQGLDDLDALLRKLTTCEQTGEWPSAEPDELELTMPSYAYPQTEDDLSDLALVGEE